MSAEEQGCGCSGKKRGGRKYTPRKNPHGGGRERLDISVDFDGDDRGERKGSRKSDFVNDEYVPDFIIESVFTGIEKTTGRKLARAYTQKIEDYFSEKPNTFEVLDSVKAEKEKISKKYYLKDGHPHDVEVSDALLVYIRAKSKEARQYAKKVPTEYKELRNEILNYVDWLDALTRY